MIIERGEKPARGIEVRIEVGIKVGIERGGETSGGGLRWGITNDNLKGGEIAMR